MKVFKKKISKKDWKNSIYIISILLLVFDFFLSFFLSHYLSLLFSTILPPTLLHPHLPIPILFPRPCFFTSDVSMNCTVHSVVFMFFLPKIQMKNPYFKKKRSKRSYFLFYIQKHNRNRLGNTQIQWNRPKHTYPIP